MNKVKFYYLQDNKGNYMNSISFLKKPMILRTSDDKKKAIIYSEEDCNKFRKHYLENNIVCFPVEADVTPKINR